MPPPCFSQPIEGVHEKSGAEEGRFTQMKGGSLRQGGHSGMGPPPSPLDEKVESQSIPPTHEVLCYGHGIPTTRKSFKKRHKHISWLTMGFAYDDDMYELDTISAVLMPSLCFHLTLHIVDWETAS